MRPTCPNLPRVPGVRALKLFWLPLDRGTRRVLLLVVWGYQKYLGWLLGGHCRFLPTCSCYAEEALQRGPLLPALWLIFWRILRCQPLCRGGEDPVPEWMGRGGYHLGRLDRGEADDPPPGGDQDSRPG